MQKTQEKQETILGKKTMLLPFAMYDMGNFVRLHREDMQGNLGRFCLKDYTDEQAIFYVSDLITKGELFVWTVYTKEDEPQLVGFIYLSDVSNYMVSISGTMDGDFAKYLNNKKGGMTYAEDADRALIEYCFSKGVNRIESDICQSNRKAISLVKRIGFIQEGILRNVVIKNKCFDNMVIFSILREEWSNGKK